MVQEITWSPEALSTFLQIIDYLQESWTVREVNNFTDRVDEKLQLLKENPRLGSTRNKKHNIHKTVLHKNVVLLYRFRPLKKEIILLAFWDTRQDPRKLKVKGYRS